jgi:mono/diheme cytochrome c family protein
MRAKEDYSRFIIAGLVLVIAILVAFQLYFLREPARIHSAEAGDQAAAVNAGRALFATNCTTCHGQNGEGVIGPALNSQGLLKTTSDATLMALIRSGVPGSVMPAWGQAFGGPLTDEQVTQLAAFIRAWEPTAPSLAPKNQAPDPARGAAIFASTCFICHGDNGTGTKRAPAINDLQRLQQFDDTWYRDTIANGRPAKGMPTWGTVLSPAQIDDLVALVGAWRKGQTVTPAIPIKDNLNGALFALESADALDAVFHLNAALPQASGAQADGIRAALDLIKKNDLIAADDQVRTLLGLPSFTAANDPTQAGKYLFSTNCAPCHGDNGTGAVGPNLHNNTFIQSKNDADLLAFVLAGRSGTAMAGFQGKLSEKQLGQIIGILRPWQPTAAPAQSVSTTVPLTPTATPVMTATIMPTTTFTFEVAQPSNPGGPGPAVNLKGDTKAGLQVFTKNCVACHDAEGKGGVKNPGSTDSEVPPLNPIDPSLVADDPITYATNLDLFLEHGSTPGGTNPALKMPAWGDAKTLTPQQIANVIAYVMSLNPPPARPSNAGGPGPAINLTGDVQEGAQVFATNCEKCHGVEGKGGVKNPGSTDGEVPGLNPIDPTIASSDPRFFAYNADLFIEHGSAPEGPSPAISMTAWGDLKLLTPQQIADAIAYLMSLNGVTPTPAPTPIVTATAAPTTTTFTVEVARPSNAGGPGPAVKLAGDAKAGTQVFATTCVKCHGAEGKGGVKNPGSTDGEVPPLNPIDPTLIADDPTTYVINLDLFLEHGSMPDGPSPAISMTAWGDLRLLAPQQIANVIAYVMSLNPPPARPSNAGGPGPALDLTGDAKLGTQVFTANCVACHGPQGKGGIKNAGSTDGTVPAINPIDETIASSDAKIFAYNLDLFLEHGSTPEGTNPTLKMPAWGDTKTFSPQQIADVIAYVMSLNK